MMALSVKLKSSSLFSREELLEVDDDFIRYGVGVIFHRDVTSLRMQAIVNYVNAVRVGTRCVIVINSNRGCIELNFLDCSCGDAGGTLYDRISLAIFNTSGRFLLMRMLQQLRAGKNIVIDRLVFTPSGLLLPVYRFIVVRSGLVVVSYSDVVVSVSNGELKLESARDENACLVMSFGAIDNACLVPALLNVIKSGAANI